MQSPEQPPNLSAEMTGQLSDRNLTELSEQSWTLCDNFLAEDLYQELLQECLHRENESAQFRESQIGKGAKLQTENKIRNDLISWVEFTDQDPQSLWQSRLQNKLEQLKTELNRGLYLGIDHFECHFAKYPPGSFYKTHIDQSPTKAAIDSERVISFVIYLNRDWTDQDGGQLQIEMPQAEPVCIDPVFGRMILFRSDTVPHAVLEAKNSRRSLTGWMRKTSVFK